MKIAHLVFNNNHPLTFFLIKAKWQPFCIAAYFLPNATVSYFSNDKMYFKSIKIKKLNDYEIKKSCS